MSTTSSAPAAPAAAAAPAAPAATLAALAPVARPAVRRRALVLVAGGVLLAGAAYALYWALALKQVESTDNAYVQGNVVQITAQVAGTVVAILADDTDVVKAGQPRYGSTRSTPSFRWPRPRPSWRWPCASCATWWPTTPPWLPR